MCQCMGARCVFVLISHLSEVFQLDDSSCYLGRCCSVCSVCHFSIVEIKSGEGGVLQELPMWARRKKHFIRSVHQLCSIEIKVSFYSGLSFCFIFLCCGFESPVPLHIQQKLKFQLKIKIIHLFCCTILSLYPQFFNSYLNCTSCTICGYIFRLFFFLFYFYYTLSAICSVSWDVSGQQSEEGVSVSVRRRAGLVTGVPQGSSYTFFLCVTSTQRARGGS